MHQIAEVSQKIAKHASHELGSRTVYITPKFKRIILPQNSNEKQINKVFVLGTFVMRLLGKRNSSSTKQIAKKAAPIAEKIIPTIEHNTVAANPFAKVAEQALESAAGVANPFVKRKNNVPFLNKTQVKEQIKDLTHEQISQPLKERLAEIRKGQKVLNNTIKEKTGKSFYELLELHNSEITERRGLFKGFVQGHETDWNKAHTAHLHHDFLGNLIPAVEERKISKYAGYALNNLSSSIHPVNGYKDIPLVENQFKKEMIKAPTIFKTGLAEQGIKAKKETLASAEVRLKEIIQNQQVLNKTIQEKTGEKFVTLLKLHDSTVPAEKEKFNALTQGHKEHWDKAYTAHLHHDFLGNLIPAIGEKKLSATNRQFLLSKSAALDSVNGYKELPKLQKRLDQINLSPEARLEEIRKSQQKLNTVVEKKTGLNFYNLLKLHNSDKQEFSNTVNSRGKQRAWKEAYTAHLQHDFLGELVSAIQGKKLTKTNQHFLAKRSANLNSVNGYRELPKLQERINQINLSPAERLAEIRKSQQVLNKTIQEKTGEKFVTLLKLHDSNIPAEKEKFNALTQKHNSDWEKAYTAHLHHEFLGNFVPAIEEGKLSKYNQRILNKKSGNINTDTGYKWLPKLQTKLDRLLIEGSNLPKQQNNSVLLNKRIASITKKQTELNKTLHQETGRSFYELLNMNKSKEPEVKEAFQRLTGSKEKKRAWDKAYTAHLYRDFLGKLVGGIERGNINQQYANKLVVDSRKVDPVRGYMQVPVLETHLNRAMTNLLGN